MYIYINCYVVTTVPYSFFHHIYLWWTYVPLSVGWSHPVFTQTTSNIHIPKNMNWKVQQQSQQGWHETGWNPVIFMGMPPKNWRIVRWLKKPIHLKTVAPQSGSFPQVFGIKKNLWNYHQVYMFIYIYICVHNSLLTASSKSSYQGQLATFLLCSTTWWRHLN